MADNLDSSFRSLFKGGLLILFGTGLELGIAFVAKVLMANLLPRADYGAVTLGITVIAFANPFVVLGIHTGFSRYLPRQETDEERRELLWTGIELVIPTMILVGVAVYLLAPSLAAHVFQNPTLTDELQLAGLAIPFSGSITLSLGILRGFKQTSPRVILHNLFLPITRFGLVAAALYFGLGSFGIMSAYTLAYVASAFLGIYFVIRHSSILSATIPSRRYYGRLLKYSIPISISGVMILIFTKLDTLMLGFFGSTKEVAVYGVVYPLAEILTAVMVAFGFLFLPILSDYHDDGDETGMRKLYQTVSKWAFLLALPPFLIMFLFPQTIIRLAFKETYTVGGTALSILAATFFMHVVAGPNDDALKSIGETRIVMVANSVTALLNVTLNVILIPDYSFTGAAIATAVSYGVLNMMYSYWLYNKTGMHPVSLSLLKPTTISIALITIIYVIVHTVVPLTPLTLAIASSVFGIAYLIIMARFGAVEQQERMILISVEERFDVELQIVWTIIGNENKETE